MLDKYDLVVFNDEDLSLEVKIDKDNETVWLTQKQMAELFNVTTDNIGLHIKNIINDKELDITTSEESSVVQKEGTRTIKRTIKIYNLDMIISVGYRIKSKRGIAFRRWANKVLKEYLIQGYSVNEKRLLALNKTIEIQNKMLATTLDIDSNELFNVIDGYTKALSLLDDYDHNCLVKPKGNHTIYRLSYNECRNFINNMQYGNISSVFGVEKEEGKLEGILSAIFQSAFGKDIYDTLEEKAANLLYFLIKDHPFADGCKRIGAAIFLEFLNKNNALLNNGTPILSNSALVALTLLVAESKPEEKEVMIKLIMNFLIK